jgi:membrane protein YdbS with pleckstrin-like domain
MLCPACSTEAPPSSAFCPKCGAKLSGTPPTATPAEKFRGAGAAAAASAEPERELWKGSFSAKAMLGSWLAASLVTVGAAVICVILPPPIPWIVAGALVGLLWLWLLGVLAYERLAVAYVLTTQRLVHQRGILRRTTNRIEIIDIDDVTVEQGFVERMLGVGTIRILSSDASDPKLLLRGIGDVKRIATQIDDLRREERRKRAVYMETV